MNYMAIPGLKVDSALLRAYAINNKSVNSEYIIKTVSEYYNIPISSIKSNCRKRELVTARQITMWIMRKVTRLTLFQIGQFFGRDHTTVIHNMDVLKDLMETDSSIKMELDLILNKL